MIDRWSGVLVYVKRSLLEKIMWWRPGFTAIWKNQQNDLVRSLKIAHICIYLWCVFTVRLSRWSKWSDTSLGFWKLLEFSPTFKNFIPKFTGHLMTRCITQTVLRCRSVSHWHFVAHFGLCYSVLVVKAVLICIRVPAALMCIDHMHTDKYDPAPSFKPPF